MTAREALLKANRELETETALGQLRQAIAELRERLERDVLARAGKDGTG